MEIIDLKKYKTRIPKTKSAFAVPTPESEIALHQLAIICSKRGSGKSTIIVSKLRDLKEQGLADRIFIISPTCISNKQLYASLDVDEDDMYEKTTKESLIDIIEKLDMEGAEWEEYQRKLKNYERMKKLLRTRRGIIELNRIWERLDITNDNILEEPTYKYGNKRPTFHLFMDDTQGCDVMTVSKNSPFQSCYLRHRHLARGLGCSLWIALQTYVGQGCSCPRSLRENCTLLLLGRTKDKKTLDKIVDELCCVIDRDKFEKAYAAAIQNPWDFLTIDFSAKKPEYTFRQNFNKLLVFPDMKNDK